MPLKPRWPFATRLEPALIALSDADFVEALYQRHLGRVADGHGKAYYLRLLQHGWTRPRVLRDFKRSPEARRYAQHQKRRDLLKAILRPEQPPLLPNELRRCPEKKPRTALLGTCLAESLLQVALDGGWPIRHFLMDSGLQEVDRQIVAEAFDAVLVNLTLRTLLSMSVEERSNRPWVPQIAPKKHGGAVLWQSGKWRRGRPIDQWCLLPAGERGP